MCQYIYFFTYIIRPTIVYVYRKKAMHNQIVIMHSLFAHFSEI